jgi:xanthine/CO dehydrogenase XdhC/CoxF family maturation factor
MNSSLIVERFEQWRSASAGIALVTVFETVGSTYSKPGHRILIGPGGDHQGLVSGGCLEGDLAEHASRAIAEDEARVVTYDLRDGADELFGLGVGCNGLLRMLVQPLAPGQDYAPFSAIAAAMLGDGPAVVASVIESSAPEVAAGATLVRSGSRTDVHGLPDMLVERLAGETASAMADASVRLIALPGGVRVLVAPLSSVPRLLVLGGGIDAVPLVRMARQLGWRVHVADHRPAYLARAAFADAMTTLVEPGRLADSLRLDAHDAVVVMSHHLATDEAYLRELAAVDCRYIGVLGPPARKARLLQALGSAGASIAGRLRGPVGLDLGADSPETIALSILAELQLVLGGGDRSRAG